MHALGQVATFSTESPIPPENLVIALNDILPAAIRVLEAAEVPAEFHARKSARAKTYRYTMFRGSICPPFRARYVWHYPYPLDEAMMQQVAGCIVGEHDFTSFAAVDPERRQGRTKSRMCEQFSHSSWQREEDELIYTVRGNGFLHHMVRNLVGTFLLVGKGTLTAARHDCGFSKRAPVSAAGATAPASGLCLVSVEY